MKAVWLLLAAWPVLAQGDRTIAAEAVPGTLVFSADGTKITAACRDNHLRTWDVATGKVVADQKVLPGAVLTRSGKYLERNPDKSVRVWDLTAERQLYLLSGAAGDRVAISADGKHLASASEKDRSSRLFDTATGQQKHVLPDGFGGVSTMTFSPDGETLLSANYDNDVRVWRTKSGELVKRIDELTGAMFAAEYTADGKQVMMAGLDGTVYVWDAKALGLVKKLRGDGETISALAISPDGKTVVTGGFDVATVANPVKVVFWDVASGKVLRTEKSPHRVVSLVFSPDGKWVAMTAGEKSIGLWRVSQ